MPSSQWNNSDAPAVGELTVEKKGEVLDGFKGGLFANSEDKEFVYKEGSLAGAVFKVYAAEIFHSRQPEGCRWQPYKVLQQGRPCGNSYNRKRWKGSSKNLPLGQYRVVEVTAPDGYVLNPNEQKSHSHMWMIRHLLSRKALLSQMTDRSLICQ